MGRLWSVLVDDPVITVTRHLPAILDELLAGVGASNWREREGSLRGLADAIDGRSWGDVAGRFERIWACALRGMDDIKDSTRGVCVSVCVCVHVGVCVCVFARAHVHTPRAQVRASLQRAPSRA